MGSDYCAELVRDEIGKKNLKLETFRCASAREGGQRWGSLVKQQQLWNHS